MTVEYKIYYDNECATQEQLDQIEQIVVEQEVGKFWEARIKIPTCNSDAGVWEGEDAPERSEFTRVRIEVKVGDKGDFVPLIDGMIVGQDAGRSSIPGQSTITLVVHDDSAKLHTKDEVQRYESGRDSEIAEQIFLEAALGGTPDVDKTEERPDNPAEAIIQRGTKMQILRSLAERNGNYYVYVLPGEEAGQSIGCFKKLTDELDEKIPKLEMFGENRNLAEFNIEQNARSATNITAARMNLRDKSITTSTASYRDATLLGEDAALDTSEENIKTRRLPPDQSDSADLDGATAGERDRDSLTLEATGSVLPLCFKGVLIPYRLVAVSVSDSRFSTNYMIFKVVHTLDRSNYTQSFTVKGNAVTASPDACAAKPQASASASVSFNMQVNIF